MKAAASMVLFALLHAATVNAGTNTWTGVGGQGGSILDVAFHPTTPSITYAATTDGFYRSQNSGRSWQKISANLGMHFSPVAIAVTPRDPDGVVVASSDGGAVRSDDRGVTLRRVASSPPGPSPTQGASGFAVAYSQDGTALYFAIDDKIYRSSDLGATRAVRGSVPASLVNSLSVEPGSTDVVYASSFSGGVFRSVDGGVSWQPYFAPASADDFVLTFTKDATRAWVATQTSLRVSTDGGTTWTPVLTEAVTDIDIDPTNPSIVYASLQDTRLMRTTNGGTTWVTPELIRLPARSASRPTRLAIDPLQSASLFTYGASGMFYSDDSARSWNRSDTGITATSTGRFDSEHPVTHTLRFPVPDHGFGTMLYGEGFADAFTPPSLARIAGRDPADVTAVAIAPFSDDALVVVLGEQKIAFNLDTREIWMPAAQPPPNVQIFTLARVDGTPELLAGTSNGVFRSIDVAGDKWIPSSTGLPANARTYVLYGKSGPSRVYAAIRTDAGSDDVYKSNDAGFTWAPMTLRKNSVNALAPYPGDARSLIVATDEGAFRTTDGGVTWKALELSPGNTNGPVSAFAIDPSNPKILYGNGAYIYRWVDGGVSFQAITPDYYEHRNSLSLFVNPTHPAQVLSSHTGGGVREITIAPDLELNSSGIASSPAGQVEFMLTLRNHGPFDATGVRIEAQSLDDLTGFTASSTNSSCTVAPKTITCALDIMRKDASVSVRVTGTAAANGTYRFNASATGAQPDPRTADNTIAQSVVVGTLGPTPGPTPTPTQPTPSGRSGGGGGGSMSVWMLVGLLLLVLVAARIRRPQKNAYDTITEIFLDRPQ